MGLFGEDIRRIDGEDFSHEADFESRQEADKWAEYYRQYGFNSRIIPHASNRAFGLWVSLTQSRPSEGADQQVSV